MPDARFPIDEIVHTASCLDLMAGGADTREDAAILQKACKMLHWLSGPRTPPPVNFNELIAFLETYPHVGIVSSSPRMNVGPLETFVRYQDGLMWFRNDDGLEHHFPVDCGMVAAETGIKLYPFGFTFTKFGVVTFVAYLPAREQP